MSQITRTSLTLALLLVSLLVLAGCGSSNPQSTFDPDSGRHPAGWLPTGHRAEALAQMETCAQCHGADFQGGIARTACTSCHIGNPNSFHPTQWGTFAYAIHGGYAKLNGTASCANVSCHGADLGGVTQSGPSCTACHLDGPTSFHPTEWGASAYSPLHAAYAKTNGTAGCANASCHGATLGGVFKSGPSCTACHLGGPTLLHPAGWNTDITVHQDYVLVQGVASCSLAGCHGSQMRNPPPPGLVCNVCH